ncbi:MAG: fibronectin, partial [Actinobacteria bacterium]|nr:fibronectin [Actinomycetota bacterium]
MQIILLKKLWASVVVLALLASILSAPTAEALYRVIPATQWGNIYAGTATDTKPEQRGPAKNLQAKSKIEVKYNNFPDWAKKEVQAAVDVWAANFASTVTINIDA